MVDAFKDRAEIAGGGDNIIPGEDVRALVANRPHDAAFAITDWLASVINADRIMAIHGGGNISWSSPTLQVAETLYIDHPNEAVGADVGGATRSTLKIPTLTFNGDERVALLKIDRRTNEDFITGDVEKFTDMSTAKTAMEALPDSTGRFGYILIAAVDIDGVGNPTGNLLLWNGQKIRNGSTLYNSGVTDDQYSLSGDTEDIRTDINQDRNLRLYGGGTLSWAGDGSPLVITEDLVLHTLKNITISVSGPFPNISSGQVYTATLSRSDDGSPSSSISAVPATAPESDSSVITSRDTYVLASCHSDGRLYIVDGTVLDPGQSRPLGGVVSGIKWRFSGYGTGAGIFNFDTDPGNISGTTSTPEYQVGSGELIVTVNGQVVAGANYFGDGTGDYTEDVAGVGVGNLSSQIIWILGTGVLDRIPTTEDRVTAMVGLSNPNRGLAGPSGVTRLRAPGSVIDITGDVDVSSPNITLDITHVSGTQIGLDISSVLLPSIVALSDAAPNTIRGNNTVAPDDVLDLTPADVSDMLETLTIKTIWAFGG